MADIGCAGILVADTFCGPMQALPREGQLLTLDSMPIKAGGCAANVGIGLVKQGWNVDVVGCLGDDASANVLRSCLEQYGVNCEFVTYTQERPTSKTVILIVKGQDRRYIHVFGANEVFTCRHIDRDWLRKLKAFYLGGLFALPGIDIDELGTILQTCQNNNVATFVDILAPESLQGFDSLKDLLPYIDYFLPNNDEAAQITGKTDPVDQIRAFKAHGANTVVITCGKRGSVANRNDSLWTCGVYTVDSIDASGAGDAFTTGLMTAVLRGLDLPDVLAYASAIGASATRAVGCTDGVFTAEEAEAFIRSNDIVLEESSL
ncbi:MAG: carbohydrate kinase family protein [Deltaproteobacteria bacterium]|nr:carbohydrate kinase family protein [Deltaproteobacteria bacterium]